MPILIFLGLALDTPIVKLLEQPAPAQPVEVVREVESEVCLCVASAMRYGVRVPVGWNAEDFTPNHWPEVGGLALFAYPNGVHHVAPIVAIHEWGVEIYQDGPKKCRHITDKVLWTDRRLKGFWYPTSP